MSVPAVAISGPVFVIARSASPYTALFRSAVLLAGFVSSSGCAGVTTAVLMIMPWVAGSMCAPMLNVALAPGASVPTVHVTTFGAVWLQLEGAPAKVVRAGSVSVNVPTLEVDGPVLGT